MDNIRKLIRKQSVEKLYDLLSHGRKIYAPVINTDGNAEYRYDPPFEQVTFDHIRSVLSVKNVVFPKVENLLFFSSNKTENKVIEADLSKIPEVVLWGSHPCDNASFNILNSVFSWDIEDKYFVKRREKLTIVGLSCHSSDEYCFCTSVGIKPDSSDGSDIFLTRVNNGDYQADIMTEKGKNILDESSGIFEDFTDNHTIVTEVRKKFSHEKITSNLLQLFDNPFWVKNSLRCIGCGACAYVCPTCACFDIQDETHGRNVRRYRSWDSCGFGLFTLHTSGHNPRSVQSQRWRQRIMHKFSYMPDRNKTLGCVGCGRCSSGCPVDMNIAEQLEILENI